MVTINFAYFLYSLAHRNIWNILVLQSRYGTECTMTYATTSHIPIEGVCHRILVFYLVKNRVVKRKIVNNLSITFIQYARSTQNTNPRLNACCGFKFLWLNGCQHSTYHQVLLFLNQQFGKVDGFYRNVPIECKQCGYAYSVPFWFFLPDTLPIEVFPLCQFCQQNQFHIRPLNCYFLSSLFLSGLYILYKLVALQPPIDAFICLLKIFYASVGNTLYNKCL